MALGDSLVCELGLEGGTNTTARWMAHHLADLIIQARTVKGAKKQEATEAAADLIMRLWSKREVVPGNVYPLKDLGNALSTLRLLEFEASPFNRVSLGKADALLAEAFDGLRKLIAQGILLTVSNLDEHLEDEVKTPFLIDEERRVIGAVNLWVRHFQEARKAHYPSIIVTDDSSETTTRVEPGPLAEDEVAKRALVSEIDNLLVTLSKLKKAL